MAGHGSAHWRGERGGRMRGRRGRGLGAAWGLPWGAAGGGTCCGSVRAASLAAVREKKEGGRRKREEKKRKEKKREKKKKYGKFSKLENFWEENKRQFMKLVRIIFVQERNNHNYN
jgi:hypothetical protein